MLKRYLSELATGVNAVDASIALADQTTIIEVKNCHLISALFIRTDNAGGSSDFEIYGSIDGTNFKVLPMLVPQANANTETLVREIKSSISNADSSIYRIVEPEFCNIKFIKIVPTINSDGKSTVRLLIVDELMS